MKIEGSGSASGSGSEYESESISQRHGSADPDPDPHQNVMDPEHCFFNPSLFLFLKGKSKAIVPGNWYLLPVTCYTSHALFLVFNGQL